MSVAPEQLYQDALQLPDSQRADLAARLIESLDPGVDADLDGAWDAEIKQRIDDLDSGRVTAVPWPEARRVILGSTDGTPAD